MATPQTIDEVLQALDEIIDICIAERSYLGIFAYVYRRTTAGIKQGIIERRFVDNERMEQFDVRFARYYIDAFRDYRLGKPVSKSWALTFDAANEPLVILQHLMIGMNAHINLDLGVTAATVAPGEALNAIEQDFNTVNDILEGLVNEMQERISRVSPLLFMLDWIGQNNDEKMADFSMRKARGNAWALACLLAPQDDATRKITIRAADEAVAAFGALLKNPPGYLLKFTLNTVRSMEEKDAVKIVGAMSMMNDE